MALISVRMPAELLQALDAWAVELGRTRSAVLRAVLEDLVDAGETPSVPPPPLTRRERLEADVARMNAIARG